MTHYRCYLVDVSGHIRSVRDLDCPNDDAAVALSAAVLEAEPRRPFDYELWQAARCVRPYRKGIRSALRAPRGRLAAEEAKPC
jgi:hypothetical protein